MRVYMHTGGGEHVYSRFSEQGPETAPLGAWPVQPPHTNPDQILDLLHFFLRSAAPWRPECTKAAPPAQSIFLYLKLFKARMS